MRNPAIQWELISWKYLNRRKPWVCSLARWCLLADNEARRVGGLIWSQHGHGDEFVRRAKAALVSLLPSVETTLCKARDRKIMVKCSLRFWLVGAGKMESWKGVLLLSVNTRMSIGKGWTELLKTHNKSVTNPVPWNILTMNKCSRHNNQPAQTLLHCSGANFLIIKESSQFVLWLIIEI